MLQGRRGAAARETRRRLFLSPPPFPASPEYGKYLGKGCVCLYQSGTRWEELLSRIGHGTDGAKLQETAGWGGVRQTLHPTTRQVACRQTDGGTEVDGCGLQYAGNSRRSDRTPETRGSKLSSVQGMYFSRAGTCCC